MSKPRLSTGRIPFQIGIVASATGVRAYASVSYALNDSASVSYTLNDSAANTEANTTNTSVSYTLNDSATNTEANTTNASASEE